MGQGTVVILLDLDFLKKNKKTSGTCLWWYRPCFAGIEMVYFEQGVSLIWDKCDPKLYSEKTI